MTKRTSDWAGRRRTVLLVSSVSLSEVIISGLPHHAALTYSSRKTFNYHIRKFGTVAMYSPLKTSITFGSRILRPLTKLIAHEV